MKLSNFVTPLLLASSLLLAGCNAEPQSSDSNKLSVYTTVYPLQYFTEQIGRDLVDVQTIYPPGADEHSFEPSQKDMMKLADSDLFVYIGLGLEGFVEKATSTLEAEDVKMVAAGESIHFEDKASDHSTSEEAHDHAEDTATTEDSHDHAEDAAATEDSHEHEAEDEHDHGDTDPHVWLDPLYSIDMAEEIKNQLVKKLPDHEEELNANFTSLKEELEKLHEDFLAATAEVEHKEFLVSHAAFGYWEQRYGLEQISVSGLTSSNEPSQKELETIIQTAQEHDITHIFFEQNVSSKLTEIVQKEINAEALSLHNLSVLNDKDIEAKRTYITIMEDNIEALKTSFTR